MVNPEVTYTQIGASDRSTPVIYQNEVSSLEKSEYEAGSSEDRPGSNPGTPRHEWIPITHLQN